MTLFTILKESVLFPRERPYPDNYREKSHYLARRRMKWLGYLRGSEMHWYDLIYEDGHKELAYLTKFGGFLRRGRFFFRRIILQDWDIVDIKLRG